MRYLEILRSNLRNDCTWRPDADTINLPMPKLGLIKELFVSSNPIGDSLVFGKKFHDKTFKMTSLFRVVKDKQGKEVLKLIRSEDPQERSMCLNGVENFHGKVLVIGAGLGVAQGFLALNKYVDSVTTVEEAEDVCNLIKNLYPKQDFFSGNYYEYVQDCPQFFDCIFIHPWNSFHYELIPYLNNIVPQGVEE